MIVNEMTPEQRRRNVRTAWILAALATFLFLTSIPFWTGLYQMGKANGL
jgi:hypothetical protein